MGQRTFADLRLPLALVAVDLNARQEGNPAPAILQGYRICHFAGQHIP